MRPLANPELARAQPTHPTPANPSDQEQNQPLAQLQQAQAASNSIASVTAASTPPTLTSLYNVLQALREGRPLTAKEKQIHSAGLVGVLGTLHDELDAAVLAAYGWSDLAPLALSGDDAPTRPAHGATPQTIGAAQPKKPPAWCAGCARHSRIR